MTHPFDPSKPPDVPPAPVQSAPDCTFDPASDTSPEYSENRDYILHVRLTDSEHAELKSEAEKTGRSMSSVMRRRGFLSKTIVRDRETEFQLIHNLIKVGNNLNQIAKRLNVNPDRIDASFLEKHDETLNRLNTLLDELIIGSEH